jgi:hypothetical protein
MKKIYFLINFIILSFYSISPAQGVAVSRGLFHVRNQFPVNLQFLSFFAENPNTVKKGIFGLRIQYSHSNTFAMSDEKSGYFIAAGDRHRYIPDINNTAQGNEYYFDTSSGTINLNVRYGISNGAEIGIDIPYIIYQHGFLDSPIEFFHNTFGYADYKRELILKNQSDLYLKNNSVNHYHSLGNGIGDIIFNLKTNLFHNRQNSFKISLVSAIKLPTGSYKNFNGSGSFDYGFNLLISNRWKNNIITNNISIIIPGKWDLFKSIDPENIYSWVIGYEYLYNRRCSFIIQHRMQNSPLDKIDFPLAAKTAFEVTAGLKFNLLQNTAFSFAVTQNYVNHENVPDFGFYTALTHIF